MSLTRIESDSPDNTQALGRRLGSALVRGSVLALEGPLGSGKTTLTKGIAEGAGVLDGRGVNSPTFVIVNEYEALRPDGSLRIYHIDAYRLRGPGDLDALGFDEMCGQGAVIIEWADRVAGLLPPDRLTLALEPTGPSSRRVVCAATGADSRRLLAVLLA